MFDAGWLMAPQNVTLPTLELLECCFFLPWQVYLLGTLSIAGSLWRVG